MQHSDFDISPFTSAPLMMRSTIHFEGKSASEVFEIMGDPEQIPNWYILAKEVRMHEPGPDGEQSFNVVFTFFGDVFEEILHWDFPKRYVYRAHGPNFPIQDYVAMIEVSEEEGKGIMTWSIFYSEIAGQEFEKALPVMLPALNDASMEKLATLIGGTSVVSEAI